jgi:hypothetical protein
MSTQHVWPAVISLFLWLCISIAAGKEFYVGAIVECIVLVVFHEHDYNVFEVRRGVPFWAAKARLWNVSFPHREVFGVLSS